MNTSNNHFPSLSTTASFPFTSFSKKGLLFRVQLMNSMQHHSFPASRRGLLLTSLIFSSPLLPGAESADKPDAIAAGENHLTPLVVTASRLEQEASHAPYTTAIIDSDFIWDNARRTLPEALQYSPGVMVQETAYGHGSPIIRGFTGRQNLLLMDGVRINNSTFRGGPGRYQGTGIGGRRTRKIPDL